MGFVLLATQSQMASWENRFLDSLLACTYCSGFHLGGCRIYSGRCKVQCTTWSVWLSPVRCSAIPLRVLVLEEFSRKNKCLSLERTPPYPPKSFRSLTASEDIPLGALVSLTRLNDEVVVDWQILKMQIAWGSLIQCCFGCFRNTL